MSSRFTKASRVQSTNFFQANFYRHFRVTEVIIVYQTSWNI